MNSAQVIAFQPGICVQNYKSHVLPKGIINSLPQIQCIGKRDKQHIRFKSLKPICAGGKGNNDENSPWKSLTNAMEKFKGQSIEEVLQKQIQKGEYFDSGGSGVKPPGGGEGGGGGGGGGIPDGSDDDNYDTRQVIFATGALICLYIYLIMRQDLERLIPDFIRYIFGGTQSVRIRRVMENLGLLYRSLKRKKRIHYPNYLEKVILNTPTWWYDPRDFHRAVRNYYGIYSR
ncbi:hypothetical protein P8452_06700 [Trifolium repens]|nr:hypothetical protein P8452_06700 [Trifolium repens]